MKGAKVNAAPRSSALISQSQEKSGEVERSEEDGQLRDVEPLLEKTQASGSAQIQEGEQSKKIASPDPIELLQADISFENFRDLEDLEGFEGFDQRKESDPRKESQPPSELATPTALAANKIPIEAEDSKSRNAHVGELSSIQARSFSKPPALPRIRASGTRPKLRQTLRTLFKHTTPAIPGFGLTLGITLFWLGALVLVPLSALLLGAGALGFGGFWEQISSAQSLAAFRLSLGTAFLAALINAVFGLLLAWVLVRQPFRGKALIDALIDLPFALPTAVAGIALSSLWSKKGLLGAPVAAFGFEVAFAAPGIVLALVFVGLPFVVRSVQPVLEGLDPRLEEAAVVLGAGHFHTFRRVVFPLLFPALLSGFSLSFARGLGEYGSVIFIAGNLPLKSEILPVLIVSRLENFDHAGATALGAAMLAVSFAALLVFNLLQVWLRRGWGKA